MSPYTVKRILECIGLSLLLTFATISVGTIIFMIGFFWWMGIHEAPWITGTITTLFFGILGLFLWDEFS